MIWDMFLVNPRFLKKEGSEPLGIRLCVKCIYEICIHVQVVGPQFYGCFKPLGKAWICQYNFAILKKNLASRSSRHVEPRWWVSYVFSHGHGAVKVLNIHIRWKRPRWGSTTHMYLSRGLHTRKVVWDTKKIKCTTFHICIQMYWGRVFHTVCQASIPQNYNEGAYDAIGDDSPAAMYTWHRVSSYLECIWTHMPSIDVSLTVLEQKVLDAELYFPSHVPCVHPSTWWAGRVLHGEFCELGGNAKIHEIYKTTCHSKWCNTTYINFKHVFCLSKFLKNNRLFLGFVIEGHYSTNFTEISQKAIHFGFLEDEPSLIHAQVPRWVTSMVTRPTSHVTNAVSSRYARELRQARRAVVIFTYHGGRPRVKWFETRF